MSEIDKSKLKMYILILDNVPAGYAPVVAAHASLACWLEFSELQETRDIIQDWRFYSFKKVVCKIEETDLKKFVDLPHYTVITESKLDDRTTALAFCPREEWPQVFKYLPLWKPEDEN